MPLRFLKALKQRLLKIRLSNASAEFPPYADAQAHAQHFSSPSFAWVLGSLCQLHRLPFDPALLQQQFPPPYDRAALLNAAQALDFKVGEKLVSAAELAALPMPCLAFLKLEPATSLTATPANDAGDPASQATDPTPPLCQPALLVKTDSEQLLYFEAGDQTPRTIALADFAAHFEPDVVLFARTKVEMADADNPVGPEPFGFKWFIPELLKHKRIWKEVLAASLAIQLVALATPLFTQVVIDKVVVHHTESTLWVVGIALIMFMLFSSVMTWMRQYLVLHTGNRVDAVLGQTVFRHLFHLPMPYFEQRQTGILVARLHGVEQIREFVSGAAVTLLLDCPFLVIFLAVMFWYSWQLSLIVLAILGVIVLLSLGVTPIFRAKLNKQFLLGARN